MAFPKKASPARRNAPAPPAALLTENPQVEAPKLPTLAILWHPQTKAFWKEVWGSPMASQFVTADHHGLFALAVLVDTYWKTVAQLSTSYESPNPSATKPETLINTLTKLAAEIRMQRQCFGLTPQDRSRLKWEIAKGEEAERVSSRSKPNPAQPPDLTVVRDPRSILYE